MNEIGSYDQIVKVVGPATTDKGANIVEEEYRFLWWWVKR